MADTSAANVTRGSVRRHLDVSELLKGGSNGFQVAICIFSLGLLATLDCHAFDVFHDDVSTPLAQEVEVNLGDAHNALRVDVHDLGHLVLCAASPTVTPAPYFTQNRGLPATSMMMPFLL
jgi:hypothetical protein